MKEPVVEPKNPKPKCIKKNKKKPANGNGKGVHGARPQLG